MKKILIVLAAFALALGGFTATTASATVSTTSAVAGELAFGRVFYNANGNDTRFNTWKESFVLRNATGAALNVKDWYTQDAWAESTNGDSPEADHCNTAIFTKAALQYLDTDQNDDGTEDGLWLPAGHTIRVYTGGGRDRSDNSEHALVLNKLRCGYNGHYLGNGGDSIYVKKANDDLVARYSYSFEHGYYVN